MTQGSPVMINSYSSLYKHAQQQQQQMAHMAQHQRPEKDQNGQPIGQHNRAMVPNGQFVMQQAPTGPGDDPQKLHQLAAQPQ